MLHGSLANGRVFYSGSGKGLGPFLARRGFDTFMADLRGRGRSSPPVSKRSTFGQTEAIIEDLPAFFEAIRTEIGGFPRFWVSHSWGGTLLLTFLARFPRFAEPLKACVFFASKRVIRGNTPRKWLAMDLVWRHYGRFLAGSRGFVSGRGLGFGDDSESRKFYVQTSRWLAGEPWIDSDDGFDYGNSIRRIQKPPILHLTGSRDRLLGDPADIRRFIREYGGTDCRLEIIGRRTGYSRDYSHTDLLTHPSAPGDHFPLVLDWFRDHDS